MMQGGCNEADKSVMGQKNEKGKVGGLDKHLQSTNDDNKKL